MCLVRQIDTWEKLTASANASVHFHLSLITSTARSSVCAACDHMYVCMHVIALVYVCMYVCVFSPTYVCM